MTVTTIEEGQDASRPALFLFRALTFAITWGVIGSYGAAPL